MWSCNIVKESIDIILDMITKKCVYFSFKLNFNKIYFVQKSLINLGQLVDTDKVSINDVTVSKVLSAKFPKTPNGDSILLSLINCGRDHLQDLQSEPINFASYTT